MSEKINYLQRKSMKIRKSGRSSDFISPSFGFGCLLNCSYCYMKRHRSKGLDIANNPNIILSAINDHVTWLPPKIPNQTHEKYYTYDISCNEDFALHSKYHQWEYIFNFFKNHNKAFGTLATKIIPENFLSYNPNNKIRIRFSLIPEQIRELLEPNTPKIIDRIKAINKFIEAGYDIHVNFSPVVYYKDWLKDYYGLFVTLNTLVSRSYKDKVKAEVIFLTHNENKHIYNLSNNVSGESLIWNPKLQEFKNSIYGGRNLRYKYKLKQKLIEDFINLHNKIIPWNTIRYIF